MRKLSLALVIPVISLPVISTLATCPESTQATNSLKLAGVSFFWNLEEKFQTRTAIASRTIQNTALFTAEFNAASCGVPAQPDAPEPGALWLVH